MEAFVYRDGVDVPRDVTGVIVHHSVRVLPPGAFRGCKQLEEVQLNEGLKEIGDGAFFDCWSLGRLNCPSTLVWIGGCAFRDCRRLSVVELVGVLKVEEDTFYGCNSLN